MGSQSIELKTRICFDYGAKIKNKKTVTLKCTKSIWIGSKREIRLGKSICNCYLISYGHFDKCY